MVKRFIATLVLLLATMPLLAFPFLPFRRGDSTPPAPVPIGLWTLDNDWYDTSGNGNTITASMGTGFSTTHYVGTHSALLAANASNYLSIPDSALWDFGANPFTISLWFKTPADGSTKVPLFSGYANYWMGLKYDEQRNINLFASANGSSWGIVNGDYGNAGVGTIVMTPESWTHIVVVRNGTSWKVYINSVLDLNLTAEGTLVSYSGARTIGRFGDGQSNGNRNTYIDDFRIYNQALTAAQVAAIYATYAIDYNGNENTGGTAPAAQVKYPGINITLTTNSGSLTKTSKFFSGWNSAADGTGTDYAVGASYTGDAALTLYAKWVDPVYFCVSGQGNDNYNGSYGQAGEFNGKPYYYLQKSGEKYMFYSFSSMQGTYTWVIDASLTNKMFPGMASSYQGTASGATPTTYLWNTALGGSCQVADGACQ